MSIDPVTTESTSQEKTEQEKSTGNLNGREVEVKEHKENAKEHMGEFIRESIQAGVTIVACPPVGLITAPKTIASASNHLIDGCKEYNEAKRIEREAASSSCSESTKENDRDSWDKEY